MNRAEVEGNPHPVLEGMAIAGYAIGASKGYIYMRAEYPLAVQTLRVAIMQAREYGLLGNNIFGTPFSFDIEIFLGSGAFVCGEETALLASLEGKRGNPRPRPPFPADKGLFGKPTVINNVGTLFNVPLIILYGADWWSSIGTERTKGTKVFCLTGKINNTGLVEVPLGVTLREMVFDIGGGIPDGKNFKAAQLGGPSGGCVPAEYLDMPIDYESLKEIGSMMGSGGMVILDEDSCMVDTARFFLEFDRDESCGKCLPCRKGLPLMIEILTKITEGKGEMEDLDILQNLAKSIEKTALCALGQTAANPTLSTIRHFRDEYEAHIIDKKCPALVCRELISFFILPDKCTGCGICSRSCPVGAIFGGKREVHVIDQNKCIKCGTCLNVCPARFSAVQKVAGKQVGVAEKSISLDTSV
jgi:NADP-reducing hydrogenase subunit HndC